MKIVCINCNGHTDSLTIGKIYDVLDDKDKYPELSSLTYRIIDDDGLQWTYVTNKFKTEQDIRQEKLNEILK